MSSDQSISSPIKESAARLDTSDVDWLLDEEHGFVVFFRPRCGSTTLTRWFFENKGVKFGGFSISAYRNEWLQLRFVQLQSCLNTNYDKLHKFVVIRDPIERAVSSYLHVVNNPKDSQWDIVRPYVDSRIGKHDLSFAQWVDYLDKVDLDRAHIIWRRQSALSCWARGVNDVVTLDSMNDYLVKMNERFQLTAQPTFNSVTVSKNEKSHPRTWCLGKKFFGDVPFSDLLQFKGKSTFKDFPDYSHFYNRSLRARIGKMYQADIDLFTNAISAI